MSSKVLRQRVAGKWQIPLLLVSLLLLAGAFLRMEPQAEAPPLPVVVEHLDRLVADGLYEQVIAQGEHLLNAEGYAADELGRVHLLLARAYYGQALRDRNRSVSMGRRIIQCYQLAGTRGESLDAGDLARTGWAQEWQGHFTAAVETFQRAIDQNVEDAADLLRHVVILHQRELAASPDRLQELLTDFETRVEDHRLDLRLWGLEQQIAVLESSGRIDEADALLNKYANQFASSDLNDHFEYLKAFVRYVSGRYDEAEALLRTIRNRVDRQNEVYAMTGWLLGRVVLSDGGPQRPQEAISFFVDVIGHHPKGPYAAASRIGQAEALAHLERHDDAITLYRMALEDIDALRANGLVNLDVLRTSLGVMAEHERQVGNLAAALEYARLAAGLAGGEDVERATRYLHQLAQLLEQRAAELDAGGTPADAEDEVLSVARSGEAAVLYGEAADVYQDIAKRNALDERRSAEWGWRAAELQGKAGRQEQAVGLYRSFLEGRPGHPLVPRAHLRIAQLYRAMGRLPEAVEAYQTCYRNFPRSLDGCRALVPLAESYLAMGPEKAELAQKSLTVLLTESDVLTPLAPEFADALFLLGDVLNQRGELPSAIATLEEAIERYPEDPRVWRARYLLADSYRKSARAVKEEMEEVTVTGKLEQMQKVSAERFKIARSLYRQLIQEYEVRGGNQLERLEQVYFRHATLYEADCYFETGDYAEALARYEIAAGTFKDSPAGLAAYVQMINCHVFLGRPREARAALARANVLVEALPDAAFDRRVSPEGREDWRRYFAWLGQVEWF